MLNASVSYVVVLSCIDTVEVILSDWRDTGAVENCNFGGGNFLSDKFFKPLKSQVL